MKALCFALLALVSLANANPVPKDDPVPVCICEVYLEENQLRQENSVVRYYIDHFEKKSATCDQASVDKCAEICVPQVAEETENLDLDHLVKVYPPHWEKYGQVVCDLAGVELKAAQLVLYSHVSCADPVNYDKLERTQLHSKYEFACRPWKWGDPIGHSWWYEKGEPVGTA